MIYVSHSTSSPALYYLNLSYILLSVGTPYCGTVFKQWSYPGSICLGLGMFIAYPQVLSQESKHDVCLFDSLVYMAVPRDT